MGENRSIQIIRKIDGYLVSLYRKLPFTYLGIFRSTFSKFLEIDSKVEVLDVGCGDGSLIYNLCLPRNFEITGVDIFKPYLDLAKKKGIYKRLIRMDVRKINFRKKFDIVLASHVIEHLTKKEGKKIIKKLEKITKKRFIVALPIGYFPHDEYDRNPYQVHKSFWAIEEMKKMGFTCKVQGIRFFWRNENIVKKYGIFSYLFFHYFSDFATNSNI